jgi:serine/threonine-protein kinase
MIGKTISHYKILSKLGEGGMGVVYKAEDLTLQRTVALKFLPAESLASASDRSRLVHEARAAAVLLHPNICPVYEIGESDGHTFIAMGYLEGQSLKERLAEGPLPLDEALRIAKEIGEGLSAAHGKGIVHRDVKPGNVMVTPEGRAVLMDFGLAKMTGSTKLTRTGATVGTVAYMSPEQMQGKEVDGRTDIWSLGVMLYEMVSGELPFQGDYEPALFYAIANADPKPLVGEKIPAGLDGIVAKALAKKVSERYPTVREFIEDIDVLLRDRESLPAGRVRQVSGLTRTWRRWRSWERAAAVTMICAVAAAMVYGGITLFTPESETIDSIGILPLRNLSGDAKGDLWADGVTERLSASLGSIGALKKIVSDQTMKQFKGSSDPLSVIGRKVGVKALVEGSLMLVGDRVDITIKLCEASKDRQIWSNTFSGSASDIWVLQSQIVRGIAENLEAELTPGSEAELAAAKSVDPMAFEIYLQGRQYMVRWELKKAEECYRRAVDIDSTLAAAWAGLANVYATQALTSDMTPADAAPLARAAVTKAVALDDRLAETQAALGTVRLYFDWDWAGADAATKRAVELNPNNAEVLKQRQLFLYAASRTEQAIALQQHICELQPFDPALVDDLGWISLYARRYDDAIAHFRKSDEMSGRKGPNSGVAMCYYLKGMREEALAESDANTSPGMAEAYIYARLGKRDKALAFLMEEQARLESGKPFNPFNLAVVNAGLGNIDEAFAWLRKSLDERWPEILASPTEPYYEDLHSDPRWKELLERIHYPTTTS